MVALPKRLTLEQFLELPEAEPALEFEKGRVLQKVSPKGRHSTLQFALAERFNRVRGRRKVVHAFPELRTTYGGRSYVPDVAVYRLGRIPVDEAGRVVDVFLEPPDIAIEIVSPEQSVSALLRKCLWYVDNGVHTALLVDPGDESVWLLRAQAAPRALRGEDEIDLADIVPVLHLTAKEVFRALRLR